jgi:hypothetical protein
VIVEPNEKSQSNLFTEKEKKDEYDQKETLEKKQTKTGEVLSNVENVVMDEMIDINKYRYNGLT